MTELYEYVEMGPGLSLLAVALVWLALIAIAVVALRRAASRRKLAEAAAALMEETAKLREGEIVLSGVVEHADDHDVAVRVDVTQAGDESESSGTWSHRWTEIDRKIVVAPFYLRLANGTCVRVLAPPDVEVADDLDQKVLVSRTSRVLSAELVPGETLHAQGWLQQGESAVPGGETGYRDVAFEWELRPAKKRMLLSSEPLGSGLAKRAAFHRRYGVRALILLAILNLMFLGYFTRALGSTEQATILDNHHETSLDSDGDTQHEYFVTIQRQSGAYKVQIYESDFPQRKGAKVALRVGALDWKLGGSPTISYVRACIAVFLVLALWSLYRMRRKSTRPWFRRKVEHSGSGRLPDVKA